VILVEIGSEIEKVRCVGLENDRVAWAMYEFRFILAKLHGSEVFYPDIEEEAYVVHQFDK
jgi:hypothetical protein